MKARTTSKTVRPLIRSPQKHLSTIHLAVCTLERRQQGFLEVAEEIPTQGQQGRRREAEFERWSTQHEPKSRAPSGHQTASNLLVQSDL